MTKFRLRYVERGGHTHVRVFAGEAGTGRTLGKCGDLVFRNEEWKDLRDELVMSGVKNVELVEDEK